MFEPIIEQCNGCDGIVVGPDAGPSHCKRCYMPAAKWRTGKCNLASHVQIVIEKTEKKVDPLKANKRSMKKI